MFKKNTSLFIPLLLACSTSLFAAKFGLSPEAHDDNGAMIVGVTIEMEGNVLGNDFNGTFVDFTQLVGQYGFLSKVDSGGDYTYTLHTSVTPSSIPQGEVVKDILPHILSNNIRQTSSANLIIELSTVNVPRPVINSNVDIEVNDRSFQATPLNSGKNILGHLHDGGDKDWFSLASAGNEVIRLELCPQSSGCFNKKSWVLYVFDSDRLTGQIENRIFQFGRWITESGEIVGNTGSSNHMYLAYRLGFFDDALIGIVDPCFDTNNTVNIGVGPGSKNYLIAISSPLLGDADGDGGTGESIKCGGGSVVLEQPGVPVSRPDADGNPQNFATTEQFISIFPYSDDQYSVTVTGTGTEPLLSDEAAAKSATYNPDTGELKIPKVLIGDRILSADLVLENTLPRDGNTGLKFGVAGTSSLSIEESGPYIAKLNSENGQVTIPLVTNLLNKKAYTAILKYNAADNIRAIGVTEIKAR